MVRAMSNAARIGVILAALLVAGDRVCAQNGPTYGPAQVLTAAGAFPAHPIFGDAFGQVVTMNGDFLFVSSFGSQPGGKRVAGAVFVYKFDGNEYVLTQTITTGGTGDHLGAFQVLSAQDWLMVSAIGTPAGPFAGDLLADQNFQGAVFIYRLDEETSQWNPAQTLDSTVPGLSDLSTIVNGGANVFTDEQGANFGLRMSLDAPGGWLFITAQYQANNSALGQTLINSGRVYAFKLNRVTRTWELKQVFTRPGGAAANDTFGASVAVKGNYAMIGNGVVFQFARLFTNGSVYVYRLGADDQWSYSQRLSGSQTGLALTLLAGVPIPLPVGACFGSSVALSENWALIGAPFESRNVLTDKMSGAAYFFRLVRDGTGESWQRTQRIESDDPRSLGFALTESGLTESTAVVPDFDRPGPTNLPQGAAHLYRRAGDTWTRTATLVDSAGSTSGGFGAGVAMGNGRVVVGSSPFIGWFLPRFVRTPVVAPPLVGGKVIVYQAP